MYPTRKFRKRNKFASKIILVFRFQNRLQTSLFEYSICRNDFAFKLRIFIMSLVTVPYQFIREHVLLTWHDALWGYERQLIGWLDIVNLAEDQLCAGSDNPLEIELSGLGKSETQLIGETLRKLANIEPSEKGIDSGKIWLFLQLAWLFKNRTDVIDALGEVETIYADFDYPLEIEGFVRYMPVTDDYDPSQHSREENERRLFSKWQQYLNEGNCEIGKRSTQRK
ncbi:MAG: DUF2247 family protein [Acidobacteria bacterium]|nr:DUF2247 family protein [Acidobacteriota bacterium]